jgi:hypothetical protein
MSIKTKDESIADYYDQNPDSPRDLFDGLSARGWYVACIYGPSYMMIAPRYVRGLDGVTVRMSETIELRTGRVLKRDATGNFISIDVAKTLHEIDQIAVVD